MKTNRRTFIKAATAAAAVPFILPNKVWAAEVKPSEKIVMGFIGMGKQNRHLLGNFLSQKDVTVVAVCDVDTTRREAAQQRVNETYAARPEYGSPNCAAYVDYREIIARDDIDAVCIATPDHWHAVATVEALDSGKDVYCEKPLTHNIHESIEVIEAVERNGGVLQTGSMQRSMEGFRTACELVRNGVIGKIHHVECSFGDPGKPCDLPEEKMEPGLDWDMWCGPGPMRPYSSVLSPRGNHDHFPDWRSYKEYGGGMVCDWGAHHLDIAQWGLGMDGSGPVKITPPEDPDAKRGCVFTYENGITLEHKDGFGTHFYGSDGEVMVNRGRIDFHRDGKRVLGWTKREDGGSLGGVVRQIEKEYLADAKVQLYKSRNHVKDFIECVQERRKPITNEIVGGGTAIACHLMNQAYYNNKELHWKPEKMRFKRFRGNKKAWLTRDYREPWEV